ncbi:hypothetical protein GGR56DRAFT_242277 [Xylariaceae sp. FL0804]|nr:hypothetical protein GGR56DRAFT_242277 [Xylariaceae sp. FL0804]
MLPDGGWSGRWPRTDGRTALLDDGAARTKEWITTRGSQYRHLRSCLSLPSGTLIVIQHYHYHYLSVANIIIIIFFHLWLNFSFFPDIVMPSSRLVHADSDQARPTHSLTRSHAHNRSFVVPRFLSHSDRGTSNPLLQQGQSCRETWMAAALGWLLHRCCPLSAVSCRPSIR